MSKFWLAHNPPAFWRITNPVSFPRHPPGCPSRDLVIAAFNPVVRVPFIWLSMIFALIYATQMPYPGNNENNYETQISKGNDNVDTDFNR
jgi:hypothetical protein